MSVFVSIPLKLSGPNKHGSAPGHWAQEAKDRKRQRTVVSWGLRASVRVPTPAIVTLCRVGPRPLDDDNLAAAFKAIRDEVAAWLGCGDGAKDPVRWRYDQRRGPPKTYAIEITITPDDEASE